MTTDIEALSKAVNELGAKEAIREVLYKYTRGMDRLDPETAKSVYHPDADDMHWGSFLGNSQRFVDYMLGELKAAKFVIHEITNPLIELDGDRAFVESRYTARLRFEVEDAREGTWLESISHGRYLDVFERRAGEWKLAHRRLAQDGGHVSLVQDLATYDPAGVGRRYPDDLVYAGAGIETHAPGPMDGVPGRFDTLREYATSLAARNADR
jgi:SnoaL-like domain